MRKILGICLSAVTVVATMAPAQAGWRKVATDYTGDTYHFDPQRVGRAGDVVQYWARIVKVRPYQGVKSLNLKMEGDCYSGQLRELEETHFDARGRNIGGHVYNQYPRYAISGTYGAQLLELACSL